MQSRTAVRGCRADHPRRQRSSGWRHHGRSGSALIATLVCLLVLMMLGEAILALSSASLNMAERTRRSTQAFNLAESGAERAGRWLKDQASLPAGTSAIDPFGGAQSLGEGTYTVSILPDPGNPGAELKQYKVISTATVQGRVQQVEVVLRQASFGKFAYFTDREVSSATHRSTWFYQGDRIRGPVHSNNAGNRDFNISWDSSGSGPIFDGMLTAAGSSINYSPSNPSTSADYEKIYGRGHLGYSLGVDTIGFPTGTDAQQVAAWGANSGFPNTPGVYIANLAGNVTGGIYVQSNVDIRMQLDGSGHQQFVLTQGTVTTTVTVDRFLGQIRKQVGSGPVETYQGTGSGVLYVDGHVQSLSGTVADNRLTAGSPPQIQARSAYTIATDESNTITVTGPIRYSSALDPSLPTTDVVNLRPGTLGLVSRNVIIDSTAPTNMEIDAVVLAGIFTSHDGSFYVQNWNTKVPTGTLKVVGGIIQKSRGPVGTLVGNSLATGYAKDYYYDPRMADYPPPYFPTTGGYDVRSWRRLPG